MGLSGGRVAQIARSREFWSNGALLVPRDLRRFSLAAVCAAVVLSSGCGSAPQGPRRLDANKVAAAFSASGISLTHTTTTDGIADYIAMDVAQPSQSPESPWLEVEVFPDAKAAGSVGANGGNIEDSNGRLVRPLAVVANVVVMRFANATTAQRRRTAKAVRSLRHAAG